jgi:hypothetical protein
MNPSERIDQLIAELTEARQNARQHPQERPGGPGDHRGGKNSIDPLIRHGQGRPSSEARTGHGRVPVIPQHVVPSKIARFGSAFLAERCRRRRDKSAPWKSLEPISTFAPRCHGRWDARDQFPLEVITQRLHTQFAHAERILH